MSDIQPGDLVVCVDASPSPFYGSCGLQQGRVYRVRTVYPAYPDSPWPQDHHGGVDLVGVKAKRPFAAYRFRKLNDGTEDQELIAKIRACKPARSLVEARYPGWQHADQCARYLAQAMSIADREAARRGETSDRERKAA